jgi:hypothetical protein
MQHIWLSGWDTTPQLPAQEHAIVCRRRKRRRRKRRRRRSRRRKTYVSRQTSRFYRCARVVRILVKDISTKCRCSACAFDSDMLA